MSDQARSFGDGTLSRVAGRVYWFLVIEGMLLLTLSPGLVLAFWLAPDASNLPLFALAAVPVGPALAAAFYAWRRFGEDRESSPRKEFHRGYGLNLADALRAWVPAVVVLLVLAINLTFQGSAGVGGSVAGPVALLQVGLAVLVLLWAVRMLSVTSVFSFRWRDAARISLHTVLVRPLSSLALFSYSVLVVGLTVVTFDAVVVLLASVLTFAVVRSEAPVLGYVRERFVAT
ncbi:DUF624 domain-containing protein [Actinotalea sp. C106]|uniref:DUF624 domain-containing protein n=1 Tax=Actinotalea sp. C106 TaxID=2908644 RepID=UPI00202798CC|nr:DUF624 domain-containing protein [Actinotalea sp. C106]